LDDEPVRWVTSSNWFVRPTDPALISASLRATGLRADLLAPALRYIDKRGARVRLSQPGDWGVSSPQAPDGSVLTNTYAAYSLYCAQLEARQHGAALNALHRDSDVVVIGLFGTDNSIGGLVAPHVIAAASSMFRPHDHTIVNHMLHFEGRKCSTSQQHGPLISDLISHTSLTTDELRYALSHLPLDQGVASLSTHDLVEHVNRLRHWSDDRMALAWQNAAGPASPRLLAALGHRQERQERHLVPATFDLASATAIVDDWILDTSIDVRRPQIAAGWLIGTALLAAPMMPQLAQDIWSGLGLPGAPSHANPAVLSASVTPAPHRKPVGEDRTAVTVAEISPYARTAATPVASIH
jgi:methionyl-tRNA synthetase